jgi:hypothetical protein
MAAFCINHPYIGRLFELIAGPLLDTAVRSSAVRIVQICLETRPVCHQSIIWDNVDLVVSILPTTAATDLLAVLCRGLPSGIESLSVVHVPSILLSLLNEVCGLPAAQARLLKLIALTRDGLSFSGRRGAIFYGIVRLS